VDLKRFVDHFSLLPTVSSRTLAECNTVAENPFAECDNIVEKKKKFIQLVVRFLSNLDFFIIIFIFLFL